ncbi:MAG: transposase, partial [Bacillota bacterium]
NAHWEQQKAYIREQLSKEETGEIYGKRKIDVEPVFGFLKANLRFTRMSVRGKSKVENELGFAFMAVNLRKYTAFRQNTSLNYNKKDSSYHFLITGIFFNFIRASYVPA